MRSAERCARQTFDEREQLTPSCYQSTDGADLFIIVRNALAVEKYFCRRDHEPTAFARVGKFWISSSNSRGAVTG